MALASKSASQLARERCLRLLSVLQANITRGAVGETEVVDAIVIERLLEVINESVITRAVDQVFAARAARLPVPVAPRKANPKPRRKQRSKKKS